MLALADLLPRELIFLLSVIRNYVVSVRGGIGCVILLRHSLGLPYTYFGWCISKYSLYQII